MGILWLGDVRCSSCAACAAHRHVLHMSLAPALVHRSMSEVSNLKGLLTWLHRSVFLQALHYTSNGGVLSANNNANDMFGVLSVQVLALINGVSPRFPQLKFVDGIDWCYTNIQPVAP